MLSRRINKGKEEREKASLIIIISFLSPFFSTDVKECPECHHEEEEDFFPFGYIFIYRWGVILHHINTDKVF